MKPPSSLKEVADIIRSNSTFLILPHIFLDGDDLGSMLSLKMILDKMGKKSIIFCDEEIPEIFLFIPQINLISNKKPHERFDAIILMECTNWNRITKEIDPGKMTDMVINIDHHPDNKYYADINWVDPGSAALGEMIYDLIKELEVPLDTDIATAIYLAIITDTGGFQFSNVTSRTHAIISDLLKFGVKVDLIFRKVYKEISLETLKLKGMVLARVRRSNDGRVVWSEMTSEMLTRTGAGEENAQNLVEEINRIKGAEVAILFKESKGDKIKVSMRSASLPVNEVAARFGGGGHRQAAGCTLEGPLPIVQGKILAMVNELLLSKI